jgi:hypothetical protein
MLVPRLALTAVTSPAEFTVAATGAVESQLTEVVIS